MSEIIKGSKGGKGGGSSRVAKEDPNTLQSKQYAKVLDLVCEGEIEGLVDGEKSIYLNNTPLVTEDNNLNYKGFTIETRTGQPSSLQTPIPGFEDSRSFHSINTKVVQATPIEYTLTDATADRAVVTVAIPRLTKQDTTNGDLHGYHVDFSISVSVDGGSYTPVYLGTAPTQVENYTTTQVSNTEFILSDNISINAASFEATWNRPIISTSNSTTFDIFGNSNTTTINTYGGTYAKLQVYYKKTSEGSYTLYDTYTVTSSNSTQDKVSKYVSINLPTQDTYDFKVVMVDTDLAVYTPQYTTDPFGNFVFSGVSSQANSSTCSIDNFTSAVSSSTIRIEGKTTSTYKKAYTIDLPPGSNRTIRVTRISNDSDNDSSINNDLYFDSVESVTNSTLSYPYSALVGISIDASQFNSIPSRAYDMKLLKVQVPSNYNPLTRTYTGVWDGTYSAPVWTDNPAWCFRDLIVNNRYGLGQYLSEENIDKWTLYELSKYCDELVPDGFGGTEPRLALNIYLQTKEEAFNVLNNIASVFRGMLFWADNKLSLSFDHPQPTAAVFNNTNVIDGTFNYSGTGEKARHNTVYVTWNDPEKLYKPQILVVEDQEDIAERGVYLKEVVAMGATTRGQASRLGQWILYSEKLETEVVSFTTSLDSISIGPGSIIEIYDQFRANVRFSGRVISGTTTQLTLDDNVVLQSGVAYKARILLNIPQTTTIGDGSSTVETPLPTIEEKSIITAPGTTNVIELDTPLSQAPDTMAIWAIYESNLNPQYFKVLSITEESDTIYSVTAVAHNPSKYDYIDTLKDLVYYDYSYTSDVHNVISDVRVSENLYFSGPNLKNRVIIEWDATLLSNIQNFLVEYNKDEEGWTQAGTTRSTYFEILDGIPGSYKFRVSAGDGTVYGNPVEISQVIYGKTAPPQDISSLNYTVYPDKGYVKLYWSEVSDLDLDKYIIKAGNADWGSSTEVARLKGTELIYSDLVEGINYIHVKALDTSGNESQTATSVSLNITAPSISSPSYSYEGSNVRLTWGSTNGSFNINHYEIRAGNTWNSATHIATLNSTNYLTELNWAGTKSFIIRVFDKLGLYDEIGLPVINSTPNAPTFTSYNFIENNVLVQWTPPTDTDILKYKLKIGTDWNSGTNLSDTTDISLVIPGQADTFTVLIKSVDIAGQESTDYDSITVNISPPEVPVVNTSVDKDKLVLTWSSQKTSFDILQYEVRYGGVTDSWNTATVLGTFSVNKYVEKVTWGTDRVYFVKAYDVYGNVSAEGTATFSITYPSLTGVYTKVIDNNILFYWTNLPGTLPIDRIELRKGADFNTAELIGQKSGTFTTVFEEKGNTYTYWLQAMDTAGNAGTETSISVLVNEPPDYVLKADWNSDFFGDFYNTIVNDRLGFQNGMEPSEIIDWVDNSGGADSITYITSDYYSGSSSALFTSTQSAPASSGVTGSIALEIPSNIAVNRLADTTIIVSVTAKQPTSGASSQFAIAYSTNDAGNSGWHTFTPTTTWQEYSFEYTVPTPNTGGTDWLGIWGDTSGTGNGVLIDNVAIYVKGYGGFSGRNTSTFLLSPVNDQETWEDHFLNNSWDQPNDQIATYPYYIEPSTGTGYYEEVFDYGQNISVSTKVSLTVTGSIVSGTPSVSYEMWFSTDNITFDRYTTTTQTIQSNFRYIKIRINITSSGGDDLYKISNINLRLDLKQKTDAGTGIVTATGGTTVYFSPSVNFLDVDSITVTPKAQGTTPVIAIYDFNDVPNPTSFTVYLYNASTGVELSSGEFSWNARGF